MCIPFANNLCCNLQVILIHLSNITGLNDDYNKRTMQLLISDIGTIVMGATAAMSRGPIKVGGAWCVSADV